MSNRKNDSKIEKTVNNRFYLGACLFCFSLYMVFPAFSVDSELYFGFYFSNYWGVSTILLAFVLLVFHKHVTKRKHWDIIKILFIFCYVFSSVEPVMFNIYETERLGTGEYFGYSFLTFSQIFFLLMLFTGSKLGFPNDALSGDQDSSSKSGTQNDAGKDR